MNEAESNQPAQVASETLESFEPKSVSRVSPDESRRGS
jgi:hypothetical protein